MNSPGNAHSDDGIESRPQATRNERQFRKLKRPLLATNRSSTPARLRGMHRRRKRRIDW